MKKSLYLIASLSWYVIDYTTNISKITFLTNSLFRNMTLRREDLSDFLWSAWLFHTRGETFGVLAGTGTDQKYSKNIWALALNIFPQKSEKFDPITVVGVAKFNIAWLWKGWPGRFIFAYVWAMGTGLPKLALPPDTICYEIDTISHRSLTLSFLLRHWWCAHYFESRLWEF